MAIWNQLEFNNTNKTRINLITWKLNSILIYKLWLKEFPVCAGNIPWQSVVLYAPSPGFEPQNLKAEGSGIEGHSHLHSDFKVNLDYMRSCLKLQKEKEKEREKENRTHLELNNGKEDIQNKCWKWGECPQTQQLQIPAECQPSQNSNMDGRGTQEVLPLMATGNW